MAKSSEKRIGQLNWDGKPSFSSSSPQATMPRTPKPGWQNRIGLHRAARVARSLVDVLFGNRETPSLYIGRLKRLETRQVLSVTAAFTGGVLDIQVASGGIDSVTLFASGNDFFVDQNNNQAQDVGEVGGLIANIGRLQATSLDQVGSFQWRGDFSRAPLDQPSPLGTVVDIAGFQQTQLQASFRASGNLSIDGNGQVTIGSHVTVDGAASITSQTGSIHVAEDIDDMVDIAGPTDLAASHGDITVGPAGTVHLGVLSALADSIEITEHSDMQLANIEAQDATLISFGSMTDSAGASIRIHGPTTLDADSIALANDGQDLLQLDGSTQLIARFGDVDIGAAGQVQLGELEATGRNLLINEDSDMVVQSIRATGNLTLESSGSITDNPSSVVSADGVSHWTGSSITLADTVGDRVTLRDAVSFHATAGDVAVGPLGTVSLGAISASGRNITIQEDANMMLARITTTEDLSLQSSGDLTDGLAAGIEVAGDASLQANSILLADKNDESLHVVGDIALVAMRGEVQLGSAGFVAVGAITASGNNLELSEDADTVINGLQATSGLYLDSSGTVTDLSASQVRIAGAADIRATYITLNDQASDHWFVSGSLSLQATVGDITVGPAGKFDIGQLTAKGRNVEIQEDADSEIFSIDVSGNFTLVSTGSVQDPIESTILIHGNSSITGTSITLADNGFDQLLIDGENRWQVTNGDLTIGPTGRVELGDILATATNIQISEDADMSLVFIQATDRLKLTSSGSITDKPGADLHAGGSATLTGTSIVLADNGSDRLDVVGDFILRSLPGDVYIGPGGLVTLGTLDIVGNNVFVSEDTSTDVRLLDANGNAELESAESLNDTTGAVIRVQGTATFRAREIVLADSPGDILNVEGKPLFVAQNDVSVGPAGQVVLGDVSADARHLNLFEDADTTLDRLALRGNLVLVSSGAVSDVADAHIDVGGSADIEGVALLLADHTSDILNVRDTVDLHIADDLVIASAGRVTLGTINATAKNISIFEDAATLLNNINSGNVLRLDSSQSIINLVAADETRGTGVQAPLAILTAGTFVHLGGARFQTLVGEFHANGLLGASVHLSLNQRANDVGVAALDFLDEPTVSGEPVASTWIDGSRLSDVQRRFSYEQSFAGQYAFYISNQTDLQVGPVRGVGDGLHLYIETLGVHDLSVTSAVQLVNTSITDGAMALIAGDQLTIETGGALETVSVTGLARDNQRVLVPLLEADAFDGGDGPAGFESTHSVILERALSEDTRYNAILAGAQNVFQHVSSQFGASGEAGFLAIVRYADGQTQLFDTLGEVFGTFDGTVGSKGLAGTFAGVIPAHPGNAGAAALFARSTPFSDVFLNGVQELPTSVVYRRSTDFFLFENGGSTDAALQVINLDSGSDRVLDVLTNAIPPSFSLPTLIQTTTPLLPTPLRMVTENNSIPAEIDQELETKIEFDATRQVVIYRVGYDDQNENGQPEDAELPSREQIVQQQRSNQADTNPNAANTSNDNKDETADSSAKNSSEQLGQESPRMQLAPGQLDTKWRDVQKDINPTPETLDSWIDLYRRHPHVGAGAYTIVEETSRTGIEVLRIFSVRDLDESTRTEVPTDSAPAASSEEIQPPSDGTPAPAAPAESSDDLTQNIAPIEVGPTHALLLAGGLVWLNKQSARAACDHQLQSIADLSVAFDRTARLNRQRDRHALSRGYAADMNEVRK